MGSVPQNSPATLRDYKTRMLRELGNSSCFEVYLNDPNSTDPKDLVTDIYVPVKPAAKNIAT